MGLFPAEAHQGSQIRLAKIKGNEELSMAFFDRLTAENYQKATLELFPSAYLTTISIIQGVALGILANNTFGFINRSNLNMHWIYFLPFSLFSFVTIILISYNYTLFIGIFRRVPQKWDAVVPFGLGFGEVAPMFFLTVPIYYWLTTSLYCIAGALAFTNTYYHSTQHMFGEYGTNIEAYNLVRRILFKNICLCLIAAAISFSLWVLGNSRISFFYVSYLFIGVFISFAAYMLSKGDEFIFALYDKLKSEKEDRKDTGGN